MECSARRRLLLLSSHLNPSAQTSLPTCLSTSSCRSEKEINGENDCVFCKIIRGEAPAFKLCIDCLILYMNQDGLFCPVCQVYEDDACLCILDTHPLSLGHSLIIPKCHFPSLDVTPPLNSGEISPFGHESLKFCSRESTVTLQIIGAMCSKVPLISNAVMKATSCDSFNLLVNNGEAAGQVIYHTHIHIIPRKSHDCLWASESLRRRPLKIDQEASQLANCIRENLSALNDCEDSKGQAASLVGN